MPITWSTSYCCVASSLHQHVVRSLAAKCNFIWEKALPLSNEDSLEKEFSMNNDLNENDLNKTRELFGDKFLSQNISDSLWKRKKTKGNLLDYEKLSQSLMFSLLKFEIKNTVEELDLVSNLKLDSIKFQPPKESISSEVVKVDIFFDWEYENYSDKFLSDFLNDLKEAIPRIGEVEFVNVRSGSIVLTVLISIVGFAALTRGFRSIDSSFKYKDHSLAEETSLPEEKLVELRVRLKNKICENIRVCLKALRVIIITDSIFYNQIISIFSRFNAGFSEYGSGRISWEAWTFERNSILDSIINLIDQLSIDDVDKSYLK